MDKNLKDDELQEEIIIAAKGFRKAMLSHAQTEKQRKTILAWLLKDAMYFVAAEILTSDAEEMVSLADRRQAAIDVFIRHVNDIFLLFGADDQKPN